MDRQLTAYLMTVHSILYERFGDPHWWPAKTPFEVCVGAILTQNTAWSNVEKAVTNLEVGGLMDPFAILSSSRDVLAKTVLPAGYFNQKAEYLCSFSSMLVERYGGDLGNMGGVPTELLRSELLAVKGVGEETADSILCYALNRPILVMDSYTQRTVGRLLGHPGPPSRPTMGSSHREMRHILMASLCGDALLYNRFHALLVLLAKEHCRKRPICLDCPLKDICSTGGTAGTQNEV